MNRSSLETAGRNTLVCCCLSILFPVLSALARADTPPDSSSSEQEDPRFVPTITWLPEPFPVEDSAATCEAEMKPYTEQISGTEVTFDVVPIPGGEFLMGSPPDESKRKPDEGPQHRVRIEPFWMGKCEVTWNEYELLAEHRDRTKREEEGRKPTKWDGLADAITCISMAGLDSQILPNEVRNGRPAVNMTQFSAKLYCKWVSAKTGRYYRLPTEAEWEYACRAGTTTAYSFGDDLSKLNDYAWYYDNSPDLLWRPGLKKPNPWGLYDMHGNVAEWTLDQYVPDFYSRSPGEVLLEPLVVPETRYPIVVRGGSWDDDPDKLRSAARRPSHPDFSMQDPQIPQSVFYHTDAYDVGFRVVRPLKMPDECDAARYDVTPEERLRYEELWGKTKQPKDLPEAELLPTTLHNDTETDRYWQPKVVMFVVLAGIAIAATGRE